MYYVVLTTVETSSEAEDIGERVVESRLAACANTVQGVNSVYRWKGNIEKSEETIVIIKTDEKNLEKLMKKIKEIHSYENPEILAIEIAAASEKYLDWIDENVK